MTVFIRLAIALALLLVAWPATGGPPQCRIAPAAEARLRLEVWGRELAGAKGAVAAHSARHVAWVAGRRGTVLEALFLVTLTTGGNRSDEGRPRWVRCRGGISGGGTPC